MACFIVDVLASISETTLEKQDLPKEEAGLDRTLSLIDTFLSSLPEEAAAMELPMDCCPIPK